MKPTEFSTDLSGEIGPGRFGLWITDQHPAWAIFLQAAIALNITIPKRSFNCKFRLRYFEIELSALRVQFISHGLEIYAAEIPCSSYAQNSSIV
jgi:hypothetical protein